MPTGAAPRVPHQTALNGIIFVLKSGVPWELLPEEMGCGSGMTCAGVSDRLHPTLLDELGATD